jgi:hypothetical protein
MRERSALFRRSFALGIRGRCISRKAILNPARIHDGNIPCLFCYDVLGRGSRLCNQMCRLSVGRTQHHYSWVVCGGRENVAGTFWATDPTRISDSHSPPIQRTILLTCFSSPLLSPVDVIKVPCTNTLTFVCCIARRYMSTSTGAATSCAEHL